MEWMELEGNSNGESSVAFLSQLRAQHPGPLKVIWDNAPVHRGEALREYLQTPDLELGLVNPPFHGGRLCRATALTSTPMRQYGDGQGRRRRETDAWAPRLRCRRGRAAFSPGWPTGKMRSNGVAGPSCKQGLKHSCGSPGIREMDIPPWLWFSTIWRDTASGLFDGNQQLTEVQNSPSFGGKA